MAPRKSVPWMDCNLGDKCPALAAELDRRSARFARRDRQLYELSREDVAKFHEHAHLREAVAAGHIRWKPLEGRTRNTMSPRELKPFPTSRADREKQMLDRGLRVKRDDTKYQAAIRGYGKRNPTRLRDLELLNDDEIRDCALRLLDDKTVVKTLPSTRSGDAIEELIRVDPDFARRAIATERPAYRSAFMKMVLDNPNMPRPDRLTDEEREAVRFAHEYKAMSLRAQGEATDSIGGFAVPPTIDASVLYTDGPAPNDFLNLCRVRDIVTKEWRGLSSADHAWAFKPEAVEAGDQSLTSIGQPSIPVHTASGFVQYSLELGEDWPNFAAEMQYVLGVGYNNLLVDRLTNGSGNGEPTGILTALAAATPSVLVTSGVDGAFSDTDVKATWAALPGVFRRNAAWMADVTVANQVRGSAIHAYVSNVPPGAAELLLGRPLYENDAMPDWTSTTGAANRLVVGDWSQMVIARRSGMYVEPVGLMPNTSHQRPDGSRGLVAYVRVGSDVPVTNAFRMQVNV